MQPIRIFTHFWGDSYKDTFLKYTYPSMMMSGNIPALLEKGYQIIWDIYCEERPDLNNGLINHIRTNHTDLKTSFVEFAGRCVEAQAIGIIATPDLIVGNHTLINGIRLIEGKKDMCLAIPHPRISRQKLIAGERVDFTNLTNRDLVGLAFKYGHKCLLESFDNKDVNLTWTGLSIRQINENDFAVIICFPSSLIFQFNQSDLNFFNCNNWGSLDRGFLNKLKNTKRIKLCGSSEICFMAEITDDSHSPLLKKGMLNNDTSEEGRDYFNDCINLWRR